MRNDLLKGWALAATLVAIGCTNSSPTRSVSGAIMLSAYSASHPVVVARSIDGRTFIATVSATGSFHLTLPTNTSYRLAVADKTASGAYASLSRIHWPVATRPVWASVAAGGTIAFGAVHPVGVSTSGLTTSSDTTDGSDGSGDGQAGGDSGGSGDVQQCGSQNEQTGDNNTEQMDNCEDDQASTCDQANETDSEGDAADAGGVADSDNQQQMNSEDATCSASSGSSAGTTSG